MSEMSDDEHLASPKSAQLDNKGKGGSVSVASPSAYESTRGATNALSSKKAGGIASFSLLPVPSEGGSSVESSTTGTEVAKLRSAGSTLWANAKRLVTGGTNFLALGAMAVFIAQLELYLKGGRPMSVSKDFVIELSSAGVEYQQATVDMLLFPTASSNGELGMLSAEGGTTFNLDSGYGFFNGIVRPDDSVLVIGGHTCSGTDDEGREHTGITSTSCTAESECVQACFIPQGAGVVPKLLNKYEIAEFYRTKNSLGFGVSYAQQEATAAKVLASDAHRGSKKVALSTSLMARNKSNANADFLYWQDIMVVTHGLLILNVLSRIMMTPIFAYGVVLRGARLRVYTDLCGGMFTSPGCRLSLFILCVITGSHSFFWLEASGFTPTMLCEVFTVSMICVSSCMILSVALQGTDIRLLSTGTMFWAYACVARRLTVASSRLAAIGQARGLGQVLMRTCVILDGHGKQEGRISALNQLVAGSKVSAASLVEGRNVDCNLADGVGLSGLEVFVKLYTPSIVVCLGILLAAEVLVGVPMSLYARGKAKTSVANSGVRGKRGRRRSEISSYEVAMRLGGQPASVFAKLFAAPVDTPWNRRYNTVSTMAEDNLIMWGPLVSLRYYPLILCCGLLAGKKTTVYFLLRWRLYIGVLGSESVLIPRASNRSKIPDYVAETFSFATMSPFFNPHPIQ